MADLRSWRQGQSQSLDKLGETLGLGGQNRARTIQRIETGESQADADLAEAIQRVTEGVVTPLDLHTTRLAWLKSNGKARAFGPEPELFDRPASGERIVGVAAGAEPDRPGEAGDHPRGHDHVGDATGSGPRIPNIEQPLNPTHGGTVARGGEGVTANHGGNAA